MIGAKSLNAPILNVMMFFPFVVVPSGKMTNGGVRSLSGLLKITTNLLFGSFELANPFTNFRNYGIPLALAFPININRMEKVANLPNQRSFL